MEPTFADYLWLYLLSIDYPDFGPSAALYWFQALPFERQRALVTAMDT